jgi:hypothetical protein
MTQLHGKNIAMDVCGHTDLPLSSGSHPPIGRTIPTDQSSVKGFVLPASDLTCA